ncbi:hypothetical protein QBC33DRAFT_591996 [Phialemonium atrogriseum]|uniref:Uncharacterized protein n=1 Tax=Phialemonium atrogriseum TaxID=1093897 RepID=A0AAJ0FKX7_9PEZI|nr:uncharacterized protein QBC33DRAFT_591996 [Phialemonium atrogriseum]KAK1771552.1 hypothetical protein QBC33DRAFT_591996 [Phialemonium atrogriseum]
MSILLIQIMPRSGFNWRRNTVTARHTYDAKIQTAIRMAGHRFDRSHVTPILADTLYRAANEIEGYQAPASSFLFGGMDLADMGIGPEDLGLGLEDLGIDPATVAAGTGGQKTGDSGLVTLFDAIKKAQGSVPWAHELPAEVFAALLTEIKAARLSWRAERGYAKGEAEMEPGSAAAMLAAAADRFADAVTCSSLDGQEELMGFAAGLGGDNDAPAAGPSSAGPITRRVGEMTIEEGNSTAGAEEDSEGFGDDDEEAGDEEESFQGFDDEAMDLN